MISDKFYSEITVKVEGKTDKELERRLMERVECYKKMGYKEWRQFEESTLLLFTWNYLKR